MLKSKVKIKKQRHYHNSIKHDTKGQLLKWNKYY